LLLYLHPSFSLNLPKLKHEPSAIPSLKPTSSRTPPITKEPTQMAIVKDGKADGMGTLMSLVPQVVNLPVALKTVTMVAASQDRNMQ
jgi:hypothetical protein